MLCEIDQSDSRRPLDEDPETINQPDDAAHVPDLTACATPESIERVATGYEFLEGPVWIPGNSDICRKYGSDGLLLFNDIPASKTYCLAETGIHEFQTDNGQSNGSFLGPEDQLFFCEHEGRRVTTVDGSRVKTTVASHYHGKRLNSPNDLVVSSDNSIWFTDPPYGVEDDSRELSYQGVYKLPPDGPLKLITKQLIKPNGLALSADERWLYVADTEAGRIAVLRPEDGNDPGAVETFCATPRPDGIRFDCLGNLWVAGLNGIEVFDSAGCHLAQIKLPERPANLEFGGVDGRTLYICARTSLYRLRAAWAGATAAKRLTPND